MVKILWFVLPFKPTHNPSYPVFANPHRRILGLKSSQDSQEEILVLYQ